MDDDWIEFDIPFAQAAAETGAPNETLQQNWEQAMEQLRNIIPPGYPFDWGPCMMAICEQSATLKSGDVIRPAITIPSGPFDIQNPTGNATGTGHHIDPNMIDMTKLVPKRIDSTGSYDYVWYIPEWSHPDFNPNVTVSYNQPSRNNYANDPMSKMRPALRAQDLARDPTDWAKRWGIHPDELGGRSRLSPTLSKSRDPFVDYANQINMLSDEGRRVAIEASRDAARAVGGGADYIAPEVLEELLTKDGKLSGKQLREELAKTLDRSQGTGANLDTFINTLNARGPLIFDSHKNFLSKAKADQDWQRLIFHDMTSDDLMIDNIITFSNDAVCDLENGINT